MNNQEEDNIIIAFGRVWKNGVEISYNEYLKLLEDGD